MSEERDAIRSLQLHDGAALHCDEGMARPGDSVPEPLAGPAHTTLSSLAEDGAFADSFLDYEIFKRLRLPMGHWSQRLGAAMDLAPETADLEYLVHSGKWHAGFRYADRSYSGAAATMCRALIAASMRILENAPNPAGSAWDWENDDPD